MNVPENATPEDERQAEPTEEVLHGLHRAHATAIPFENLDIALGRGIRLDLPGIQEKLLLRRRGGYCFEHNLLFAALLERLSFAVTRLAARVRMGNAGVLPSTHMTLSVSAGSRGSRTSASAERDSSSPCLWPTG